MLINKSIEKTNHGYKGHILNYTEFKFIKKCYSL